MDDKNVQNENLTPTEPVLEEASVEVEAIIPEPVEAEAAPVIESEVPEVTDSPEAEIVDTTVMPKVDFSEYMKNETVVTIKKEEKKKNGFAIASMVCGIVGAVFAIFGLCGLCCCCWPITIPASICAVIFAFVDRSKNKQFCGMTIAGLICGIIGIVTPFAFLVFDFIINYGGDVSKIQEEFWNAFNEGYNQFE